MIIKYELVDTIIGHFLKNCDICDMCRLSILDELGDIRDGAINIDI